MRVVRSVILHDEKILRLDGDGFNFPMTWTAEDQQLVAVGDGSGWAASPVKRYYSTRLFAISGGPTDAAFHEVGTYPQIPIWDFIRGGSNAPYYGLSILSVDGRIYQGLSTWDHGTSPAEDCNFTNVKLIYSPDQGRNWHNQDGSTPVVQETQRSQSRENMAFYREPQDAFSILSFLQMGRDYADNRDGYVYVYSPNGAREGTMNELVMLRVPKAQVLNRSAYEFFAEQDDDGQARWVKDINARGVIHTFPGGWVSPHGPLAWQPSVTYNSALRIYMMACSNSTGGDCKSEKPTYLGFWTAPNPWGPWTHIHEERAWMPGGDSKARPGWPQIAPKWVAVDGKSFWLVWTDVQKSTTQDVIKPVYQASTEEEFTRARARWREYHPRYAFNAQRVDLVLAGRA